MSPDCPNSVTPRQATARRGRAAQEAQRVRVPVQHGDERARRGEQRAEDRVVAVAQPPPRLQRAEDEVGAREHDDLGAAELLRRGAASASGTTAPTKRCPRPPPPAGPAAGRSRRRARPPAGRATAHPASAWSSGRVESRKYDAVPSGRPSRPRACRKAHSKSWVKAGSQPTHRAARCRSRGSRRTGGRRPPGRGSPRSASRRGSTGRPRRSRTTTARARASRTGRRSSRRAGAARRRATTWPRALPAGRRG